MARKDEFFVLEIWRAWLNWISVSLLAFEGEIWEKRNHLYIFVMFFVLHHGEGGLFLRVHGVNGCLKVPRHMNTSRWTTSKRRNFATGFIVVMLLTSKWSIMKPWRTTCQRLKLWENRSKQRTDGPGPKKYSAEKPGAAERDGMEMHGSAVWMKFFSRENSQAVKQKSQAWQFVDKQGEPSGIWGAGCKPYKKNTVFLQTENDSALFADRKTLQCMLFSQTWRRNCHILRARWSWNGRIADGLTDEKVEESGIPQGKPGIP